jgi:hypothetical protein
VVEKLHQIGKNEVSGKFSSNCSTTIGLAVYGAPGPKFDPKTADQQTFEGVEFVHLAANKIVSLSAYVPSCFYQADAFTGDVILKLSATNLYGSRLLGPAATGGSNPCESSTPTPTVPKPHPVTTTTTVKPRVTTTTTVVGTDHDTGVIPSTTTTTEAPQLASATELPRTGSPVWKEVLAGTGLLMLGLTLLTIIGVAATDPSRR